MRSRCHSCNNCPPNRCLLVDQARLKMANDGQIDMFTLMNMTPSVATQTADDQQSKPSLH
jgi:hypothetical protein